jgi:hypothetical protein
MQRNYIVAGGVPMQKQIRKRETKILRHQDAVAMRFHSQFVFDEPP